MNNKKGFTLLELMVAIAIIGVVISMVWSLMIFGNKVYVKEVTDYDIQSKVRVAMSEISDTISQSNAAFAVPDASYLDAEWNYLAVSNDGTRVVNYIWNSRDNRHDTVTLVGPYKDVTFDLSFFKDDPLSNDNTVKLRFDAIVNGVVKRFDILTGYESLNALQIVDYGSELHPAKSLAYRTDDLNFENLKIYVNIALVLDTSGSMNSRDLRMSAGSNVYSTRIDALKRHAKNLIDQLSENDNEDVKINVSLIEFNTSANNPKPFNDVNVRTTQLKTDIDKLCTRDIVGDNHGCEGGTNTGDGLRRAYYMLNDKSAAIEREVDDILEEYVIKNYVILLTDGDYSYYSKNMVKRGNSYYSNISICNQYRNANSSTCNSSSTLRSYTMVVDSNNSGYYLADGNLSGITYLYKTKNRTTLRDDVTYVTDFRPYYTSSSSSSRSYTYYKDDASYQYADIDFAGGAVVDGRGNTRDTSALTYIQRVAQLGLNRVDDYTNYLIGFSPDASTVAMDNIQSALRIHNDNRFHAYDDDELGLAFTQIKTSIVNDTWHYVGPKLIGD